MIHINTHLVHLHLVVRQPSLPLHRVYQIRAEKSTDNPTTRSSSSIGNAYCANSSQFPPLA